MLVPVREGVATVWLDRPDRGNALSPAIVTRLYTFISAAIADHSVHTLVLRGQGKHFCTGFDISNLKSESDLTLRNRFLALESLLQLIWYAPVRTVAFGNGRVWGAGADLFASCDIRACAIDTTFRFPGAAFGILLGTRRLAELIGWNHARPLVIEGGTLDAHGALAAGLATDVVEGDPGDWLVTRCSAPVADRETFVAIRSVIRGDHRAEDERTLNLSASRKGLMQRIEQYRQRSRG